MARYRVRYFLADYKGTREVDAEDSEEAIAKVRRWARAQTSLPMYADGYEIEARID
jgi:hypothetical protein